MGHYALPPHAGRGRRAALLASVAIIVATGSSGAALAQEADATVTATRPATVGEVIVTARRRAENVQDVPAAITALTTEQLRDKQITTSADLKFIAPSLSVQGRYGKQGGTYAIRGLAGAVTGASSVGTYFAEVPTPQANSGFDVSAGASLYDLESVQVLKGPQGTLFGRTSTAGAVLLTPRKPSLDTFGGDAEVILGSLGRAEANLALNIPILKDVLGIRLSANRNRLEGFTKVLNTDQRFDETNTRAFRVSAEFRPTNWLSNSTVYDNYRSDGAPGAFLVSAYNPLLPNFNLPANTTAFNTVCNNAVNAGLSPNASTCIAQRLALLTQMRNELAAEYTRTSAGGSALRYVNAGDDAPYREISKRQVFVNTTVIELPSVGDLDLSLKNIFGYQQLKGYTLVNLSGTPTPTSLGFSGAPGVSAANQLGNQIVPGEGDGYDFYTDEIQLSGDYANKRLVWVAGYYYQKAPLDTNRSSLPTMSRTLGGVSTVNLGYSASSAFPIDGASTQKAYYGQATLSLDGLLDGVSLTAGFRHSKDRVRVTNAAAVLNPATGVFSPSATQTTTELRTSGDGYNLSIDYRVTPSILVYAAHRKGYVPGGLNNVVASSSGLANYAPVYGPEKIKDYEIGAKTDFAFGDVYGRLNLALYHADYSDIQRLFTGIASTGATVLYTANVAAANLSGLEAELFLQATERLSINAGYSYNKTGYSKWLGADPLNIAPAGTILDMSDNPLSNAPKHKFNATVSYDVLQSDDLGEVTVTGSVYAQSLEWFSANSQRFLNVYETNFRNIYGVDLADAISQRAYAVFNAKVEWSNVMGREGLILGAFVRNIGDKIYTTSGISSLNTVGVAIKSYAEPRTYGVQLAYHF